MLTVSSGTVTLWEPNGAIAPGISGGSATVENVIIEGTNVELPDVAITGTLTIKYAGSVATTNYSGYPQYGASSTLVYDCGTAEFKVAGKEWKTGTASGAGVPKAVSLSNSKVTVSTGADYNQLSGDLAIDATSTLNLANELRIGGNFSKADGGTFTHNERLITFNGAADQTITLLPTTSAVEFYHVAVDKNSGTLNLSGFSQMTVKNSLTMTKGNIAVGENATFLVDDGVIMDASASSFFTGRLTIRRTFGESHTMVYPVGGGTSYRPVTLLVEQSSPSYAVALVNTAPAGSADGTTISALSTVRYYVVNKVGGDPTKVRIKLVYGADDGVTDQSTLKIAAVESGPFGTPYSSIGPTPQPPFFDLGLTPGEMTSDELTSLPWTYLVALGNTMGGSNPLPVELTSFTASVEKEKIVLAWNTATELNNAGYNVERKAGHGQWTGLGFVDGHGTTNAPQSYTFVDTPGEGNFTYRLKQIDRDGAYEYSKEVEVTAAVAPTVFALSQNYPNPFNPSTTIAYQIPSDGFVTLKVYDMLGKEVASLVNENKKAGRYTVAFDGGTLSSGLYICRMHTGLYSTATRMLLTK